MLTLFQTRHAPTCSRQAPHIFLFTSSGSGGDTRFSVPLAVAAVVSSNYIFEIPEAAARDFLPLSLLSFSDLPPSTGTFLSSATLEVLLLLHSGAASLLQTSLFLGTPAGSQPDRTICPWSTQRFCSTFQQWSSFNVDQTRHCKRENDCTLLVPTTQGLDCADTGQLSLLQNKSPRQRS